MIAQVLLSSEYLWSCETVSDAIVEVSLLLNETEKFLKMR
jgi:hypothetical protein